jgi:hypothetical protein
VSPVSTAVDRRACERISLRDVVRQIVAADGPLTSAEIHQAVLVEYGACSRGLVDSVLHDMVAAGVLRREDGRYVTGEVG